MNSSTSSPGRDDRSSLRIVSDAPTLVQIWQFCTSESQPDCACLPRLSVDESARVERLDHLMHDGRRDPEEATEVCFSRWHAVNLAEVIDERQVLALLGRERRRNVNEPRRTRRPAPRRLIAGRAILCRASAPSPGICAGVSGTKGFVRACGLDPRRLSLAVRDRRRRRSDWFERGHQRGQIFRDDLPHDVFVNRGRPCGACQRCPPTGCRGVAPRILGTPGVQLHR